MKQKPGPRELAIVGLLCLVVAIVIAWVNRGHQVQAGTYHMYLKQALFFRGELPPPLLTYPIWGYPLVLAVLPAREVTSIALQIVVAVAAMLLLYWSTAPYLRRRAPLAVLTVLALPWWTLASVKLADIWATSIGVMALLALAEALRTRKLGWSVASGLLFGISMNFRTDFLLFLIPLPLGILLFAPTMLRGRVKLLAVPIALGVLLLVPWGIYRVHRGYSFGITSTNAGMVLYNSLGFQGNRWGIVADDFLRQKEVGAALGPGVDAGSAAGSRYLMHQALEKIAADPLEFGRKIAAHFLSILKFGFYGIEVEPLLNGREAVRYGVLKEQIKVLAGSMSNQADVRAYKAAGLWDPNFSLRSINAKEWTLLILPLAMEAFSLAFLLVLLGAVVWIIVFQRSMLREPLFLLSLLAVLYVWALLCLLQYEQRQANVFYPLGLPLVLLMVDRLVPFRKGTKRDPSEAPESAV